MVNAGTLQKRIKSHFSGQAEAGKDFLAEGQLVAEQQFVHRRKIRFSDIARKVGVSSNTVKQVALGVSRNEKVMAALLEEWRKIKAQTEDYEFWRMK
jgi:hypothetical protein